MPWVTMPFRAAGKTSTVQRSSYSGGEYICNATTDKNAVLRTPVCPAVLGIIYNKVRSEMLGLNILCKYFVLIYGGLVLVNTDYTSRNTSAFSNAWTTEKNMRAACSSLTFERL